MSGLQWVVNGAIDLINDLISGLNSVLGWIGVDIGLIERVTFGDDAQADAQKKIESRNAAYADYEAQIAADRAKRQAELQDMADKASSAWTDNVDAASNIWQDAVDYAADARNKDAANNTSQDDPIRARRFAGRYIRQHRKHGRQHGVNGRFNGDERGRSEVSARHS